MNREAPIVSRFCSASDAVDSRLGDRVGPSREDLGRYNLVLSAARKSHVSLVVGFEARVPASPLNWEEILDSEPRQRSYLTVFRLLRSFASIALFGCLMWAAFTVKLGSKTFAEHIDSISDTREAKELMEGTRITVNPVLDEAKERVLGEYVEAPTFLPAVGTEADAVRARSKQEPAVTSSVEDAGASTGDRAKLPGRR